MLHPLITLTQRMQLCLWWHNCYHITLMPIPVLSHDQKSHAAPCSSCLYLWITLVPLMLLMTSWDTDYKLSKCYVARHFDCLDLRNAMMPLKTSVSHDAWPHSSGVTWCKKSCCKLFWSSRPKECIGITWHQHQCQCHWQRKVKLHLLLIAMT